MARLCRPAEISLRVDTQRIAKDAVIIVMTGDNIGHMLATALHKGPVLSKEGLPRSDIRTLRTGRPALADGQARSLWARSSPSDRTFAASSR